MLWTVRATADGGIHNGRNATLAMTFEVGLNPYDCFCDGDSAVVVHGRYFMKMSEVRGEGEPV